MEYNFINELYVERINEDNSVSWIPIDESNRDYQQYLAWVEGQNIENN
jgi:hypothetical protein